MIRTALEDLRRSCIWMSFFAVSFVFMYLGVVLLTKYRFTYFQGYLLEADPSMLRLIFYLVAGASVWAGISVKKKRASMERLTAALREPSALLRHLLVTFIFAVSLALVPLLSGFFLFFLGAMYLDFYVLAVLSLVLIYLSVPRVEFWEERIKDLMKA